eukprot:TRINITY_DN987_c0_g1_i12.p1 TRINITY_DN987_c0_g1~~TRINITY_DN987_c0_g1_i12.p1  ORF type:complete len:848 (+),score=254.79 TRINITY_DN987_c0_g1_i12:225-2546(+)
MAYFNSSDSSIEAELRFDHYQAALTNFQVVVNGKTYQGVCKEKNDAEDTYDDAIASGNAAYLLKEDKDGVFRVSIGNIGPKVECKMIIRYVVELDISEKLVSLKLPVTKTSLLEGLDFSFDIEMPHQIKDIKSTNHKITNTQIKGNRAFLIISTKEKVGKEIELLMTINNPHEPVCFVENYANESTPLDEYFLKVDPKNNENRTSFFQSLPSPTSLTDKSGTKAVQISLYPSITTDEDILTEIIFVIDRSGSMSGTGITNAKNTLQLLLRSLPQNTPFNIVSFGSNYSSLFTKSTLLTAESLNTATAHISSMGADMGETELLEPLQYILNQFQSLKYSDYETYKQYPKQIFLLTDGGVSNLQSVLQYVKFHIDEARIFSFGIGSGVSRPLVDGIAEYGRGKAEYVDANNISLKVTAQLKAALMPILKNVSINWNGLEDPTYTGIQMRYPPVFDGDRLVGYCFLKNDASGKHSITISGTTGTETHKWDVIVDLDSQVRNGSLINRLTARTYASSLELDEKANKDKIVKLGTEWGLVTKYTSYVAIEDKDYATISTMQKLNVKKETKPPAPTPSYSPFPATTSSYSPPAPGGGGGMRPVLAGPGSSTSNWKPTYDSGKVAPKPATGGYRMAGPSLPTPPAPSSYYSSTTSPSPSTTTTATNYDPKKSDLDNFILLQNVDGSFNLSELFLKLGKVNKSLEQVKGGVPGAVSGKVEVWITAIALVIFEKQFAASAAMWEMIAEKSRKYIRRNITDITQKDPSCTLDNLLQLAKTFLL